ncbi:hypothetical protein FHW89_005180 [Mucilaginibacter sp. SG564]|nr:hypothetical protein [Mucilaginibacter sp. SG564]
MTFTLQVSGKWPDGSPWSTHLIHTSLHETEAPSKRRSPHVIISPKRGDFKKSIL